MNEFLVYEEVSVESSDSLTQSKQFQQSQAIDVGKELDSLFPPKLDLDESKVTRASRKQSTAFEINELKDRFDNELNSMDDEHPGFSDKLSNTHHQLFDELIRQEIVACPDRGLLFVQIRDEMLETLKSMRKLYISSFSHAIAKDILSQKVIRQTRNEIKEFTEKIPQAKDDLERMMKEREQKREAEKLEEHIGMVKRTFLENQITFTNEQMTKQLKNLIDTEHRWLKDE